MRPEFKEAVKIAATGEYKCIPVSLELYADQYTPLMVLRKLKNVSRHCYMLESAGIIRNGDATHFWDMTRGLRSPVQTENSRSKTEHP